MGRLELAIRDSRIGVWSSDLLTGQTLVSADLKFELGYSAGELPFDLSTGEVLPDVWADWLMWDPVEMARRDRFAAAMAGHIIRSVKPNLIAIHLMQTDEAQHNHGPRSPEARVAFANVDRHVAEIIGAVLEATKGNKSKTALRLGIKRSTLGDRIQRCGLDAARVL